MSSLRRPPDVKDNGRCFVSDGKHSRAKSSFPVADEGNNSTESRSKGLNHISIKNMAQTNPNGRVMEDDLGHLENAIDKIVIVRLSCVLTLVAVTMSVSVE